MASRIFEFRVIGFDSVFHLNECTKELVLSTKKRRAVLRAAAVSPVFPGTKSRQPRLSRGPAQLPRDAFTALPERGAWTTTCALTRPPSVQFQCHYRANCGLPKTTHTPHYHLN